MRSLSASLAALLLVARVEDLSKVSGPPPEGAPLRGNSVVDAIDPEPEPEEQKDSTNCPICGTEASVGSSSCVVCGYSFIS